MVGQRVAHYRVLSEVGRGGMGVVYLAEDEGLGRRVALKFIRADAGRNADADARLVREARAASVLDHPNVATIYEIGEWQGQHFIAMAWYDGETLAERLAHGRVPLDDAVTILMQVAEGLARAHAAGIVHRDLKPGNILLTRDGVAKILDFGLAAYSAPNAPTQVQLTGAGSTMGTLAYMAPEQCVDARVDARADVWALGVIAFELFAGQRPFAAPHAAGLLHAIQYDAPADLKKLAPELPDALRAVVTKALEKNPAERLASAEEFGARLRAWRAAASAPAPGKLEGLRALRRPMIAIPLVVILLAAGAFAIFTTIRQRRAQWARAVAFPEATRLVDQEKIVDAFDLATSAQRITPDDPVLAQLLTQISRTPALRSEPAGATVSYKDYAHPESDVARPRRDAARRRQDSRRLICAGASRKPGSTRSRCPACTPNSPACRRTQRWTPRSRRPARHRRAWSMCPPRRCPSACTFRASSTSGPSARWRPSGSIDSKSPTPTTRSSSTPAAMSVANSGRSRSWIKARPVDWEHALARFVDSTGRPGPAAWVQSEPAAGEDQLPVTGVSWYEAAAYARFAGKSLPSLHHWARAAEPRAARWVVPFSNFGGRAAAAVAARQALHASGAYDMAGNVKEWTSTDTDDGRRYLLGGAWDEPIYTFNDPDARAPFDRGRTFGFRCVTYPTAPTPTLLAAQPWLTRDYAKERPAPDQVFEIYRRLYAYDRQPFTARTLAVAEDREDWRRETVVMPAPYGGETMKVFLFVPKHGTPPFETVVFFPGSNAFRTRSIDQFPLATIDFLVKSGRAVAFPELKGTFDRQGPLQDSTANPSILYRDHVIAWTKDVSRAIDYLATRQDLSLERLAFFGISWGGRLGTIIPAVEPRIKVQVLVVGGFSMQRPLPEVDQFNFASRIAIPTLMLNGRYDFFFPVDSSQNPMFEALRTPKDQKKHLLYDGGHNIPRVELIKETLGWLDRFQRVESPAPVKR